MKKTKTVICLLALMVTLGGCESNKKEDVEWGFSYFLPELKKTGCKIWGFILPKVSEIEGGSLDAGDREEFHGDPRGILCGRP